MSSVRDCLVVIFDILVVVGLSVVGGGVLEGPIKDTPEPPYLVELGAASVVVVSILSVFKHELQYELPHKITT